MNIREKINYSNTKQVWSLQISNWKNKNLFQCIMCVPPTRDLKDIVITILLSILIKMLNGPSRNSKIETWTFFMFSKGKQLLSRDSYTSFSFVTYSTRNWHKACTTYLFFHFTIKFLPLVFHWLSFFGISILMAYFSNKCPTITPSPKSRKNRVKHGSVWIEMCTYKQLYWSLLACKDYLVLQCSITWKVSVMRPLVIHSTTIII